jgi:hypothetical protein
MRRLLTGLSLALAGVLLCAGPAYVDEKKADAEPAPDGTKFLDKDLSNWEGLKKLWSYKDGALVGNTGEKGIRFNTFLCSKKKYKDFEMSCKVRLKDGAGNSGVQVRSKIADAKTFAAAGPQCDIGTGWWGSLYGERFGGIMLKAPDKVAKLVKNKDFNDYHIKVVGQHVTIKINGETSVDETFDKAWAERAKGRQALPADGIIAFQLHAGGPMEVTFKDIVFKELPSK